MSILLNSSDRSLQKQMKFYSQRGGNGWFQGDKLQLAREFRGLTLKGLARLSKLNIRDLREWESIAPDRPNGPQLDQLCKVLDFPIGFFLTSMDIKMDHGFICGSHGCEVMTEPRRTKSNRPRLL